MNKYYPKNLSWAMGTNLITVAEYKLVEEEIEEIAKRNKSDKDWLKEFMEYAAGTEDAKYQERKKKALREIEKVMDVDAKKEGTLDAKYKESKRIDLMDCARKMDEAQAKKIMEKETMQQMEHKVWVAETNWMLIEAMRNNEYREEEGIV